MLLKKVGFRKTLLLFLVVVGVTCLSAQALARAGGGGSSSSGSSSRGSGGGRSLGSGNPYAQLFNLGIQILLPIGMLLHVRLVNLRISRRRKEISLALEKMRQREPEWSESRLSEIVREKFWCLQTAWSQQNMDEIRKHVHPELYPYWEAELRANAEQGFRNIVENVRINAIQFVAVGNFIHNEDDRFTVCIDAQCDERYIPTPRPDNQSSQFRNNVNIRNNKFREFWTFEREKNDWMLKGISQYSAWTRFVESEVIYELQQGPKPRIDVRTSRRLSGDEKETKSGIFLVLAYLLPILLLLPYLPGLSSHFLSFKETLFRFTVLAIPMSYFIFQRIKSWIYVKLEEFDISERKYGITMTLVWLSCLALPFSVLKVVNSRLDWSDEYTVRDTVLEKVRSQGRRNYYFYSVNVIPQIEHGCCTTQKPILNFAVKKSVYDRIKFGHTQYKLVVREGALRVPWVSHFEIVEETLMKEQPQTKRRETRLSSKTLEDAKGWNPTIPNNKSEDFRVEKWLNGEMKSKEPMFNGQVHGLAQYRFSNGQLYGEIPYRQGQKHGRFTLFREDGTKDQELSYKEGQPHGVCRWYDEHGKLKQEEIYVDGKLIR